MVKKYMRKTVFLIVFTIALSILFVVNSSASWASENPTHYIINSTNYYAICSKQNGLCSFYNYSGTELLSNVGDVYIGGWIQSYRPDFSRTTREAKYDDNITYKHDLNVSYHNLAVSENTAILSFSQNNSYIRVNTTYTFYNDSSKITGNVKIIYLSDMNITNEIIKLDLPVSFEKTIVDPFEPAQLIGDTQWDSMDSTSGWGIVGNGSITLNTDSNYIKEGSGSIKFVAVDDKDGISEYIRIYKTTAQQDFSDKNWISFWIYPTKNVRLSIRIRGYNATGSEVTLRSKWLPSGATSYYPANKWSLVQWKFRDICQSGLYCLSEADANYFKNITGIWIEIFDNGTQKWFEPPNVTIYIDDIRYSREIRYGLAEDNYGKGGWWAGSGYWYLDYETKYSGNSSLRWENANLTDDTGPSLFLIKPGYSNITHITIPTNLSDYDYLTFKIKTNAPKVRPRGFFVSDAGSSSYDVYIPSNGWVIAGVLINKSMINEQNVTEYRLTTVNATPSGNYENATVWIDDIELIKDKRNLYIFDTSTFKWSTDGKGIEFSPMIAKINDSNVIYIYGNYLGASGIELMEKNYEGGLDLYLYSADRHIYVSFINRSKDDINPNLATYKETLRKQGDISEGTFVIKIESSEPSVEVVKSRWPRLYKAAWTMSDDDLYGKEITRAVYYGTSNVSSPNYGKKGIIGHNLRITKNLWTNGTCIPYYSIYTICSLQGDPQLKSLIDDMYNNHGIEISLHTPSFTSDDRTLISQALQIVRDWYNTIMWVDHSMSDNYETIAYWGAFPENSTYYSFDLIKDNNIKYAWVGMLPVRYNFNLFHSTISVEYGAPLHKIYTVDNESKVYFFVRGGSDCENYNEFMDTSNPSKGCANTTRIENELIKTNGLQIIYTHLTVGSTDESRFYKNETADFSLLTIKEDFDNFLAWIEQKQNEGILWVATVSEILDWLLYLENVSITDQNGSIITIKNNNQVSIRGVTLKANKNISSVILSNGLYNIYVNNEYFLLPKLNPGETITLTINTGGGYDTSIPRVYSVDPHLDIETAVYDKSTKKVAVTVLNNTNYDIYNKSIALIYNQTKNFIIKDNGIVIGKISNGNVVDYDNNYKISYNSITGLLNITIPHMSTHTIEIEEYQKKSGGGGVGISPSYLCNKTYEFILGHLVKGKLEYNDNDVELLKNQIFSETGKKAI